jgi:hypothetical protein
MAQYAMTQERASWLLRPTQHTPRPLQPNPCYNRASKTACAKRRTNDEECNMPDMPSTHDRRDFVKKSLVLAGAAGLLASGMGPLAAQTFGPMRRSNRYDDTFIFERKPYLWPGNKTLAVWIAPNVEVWHYDSPVGQAVQPNVANRVPDVVNYAWREYGIRVGLWRIADVLDEAGVKATVALNSAVCETFPKAMDEMKKRGWEFMGHGTTNSENLGGLNHVPHLPAYGASVLPAALSSGGHAVNRHCRFGGRVPHSRRGPARGRH